MDRKVPTVCFGYCNSQIMAKNQAFLKIIAIIDSIAFTVTVVVVVVGLLFVD